MIRARWILRGATLAVAAAAVSGCISVLPKTSPVQLYRFGAAEPPLASAAAAPWVSLVLGGVSLPRAAAGDGVLTVRGDEAAYIAGARWVSPATVLMQEAVERAFAARAARVRLLRRTELGQALGRLTLEFPVFETRYPAGGGPPSVAVTLRATLVGRDGTPIASKAFAAIQPTGENRVAAIVTAYDAATSATLDALVAWADGAAARLPAPPS